MNRIPSNEGRTNEAFVFKNPDHQPVKRFQFLNNLFVEMGAAGTSVTAYHPLRTITTVLANGDKVKWRFPALYKGYFASALGAHQLFLMAEFERRLKDFYTQNHEHLSLFERTVIGAIAGVLTAPTVTPCDMWMMQKQLNQPRPQHVFTLFRGFVPMAFRQAGLGAGMFILPSIIAENLHQAFPRQAEKHERVFKMGVGFFAGCVTATATQAFEMARILMQSDAKRQKYKTTWSACRDVPGQMIAPRGLKIYLTRLSVIGVATVVMFNTREMYSKWLYKEAT